VTDDQFAELLQLKHEVSGVEFKPPGQRTDAMLFHTVARGLMGMANRRNGGRLVIGVREASGKFELLGLTSEQTESWHYDHVADKLAPLADPPVAFDIEPHEYQGRQYLLIEVAEFEDAPVICLKDFPRSLKLGEKAILRKGAVYVRPRRKPETSEIATQADMRELLDLATEKRLRSLMGTVARVGARLQGAPSPDEAYTDELPDDFR
jgi:predicted HTH transcriptional regulator